jgi:hypothetical protein
MLGDEIGNDTYRRVYKGLDLENGDFVAIKQVSMENIRQEDLIIIMVRFGFLLLSRCNEAVNNIIMVRFRFWLSHDAMQH